MPWTTVVSVIRNEHHLRILLMGSIAAWNLWKIRLALKNLFAALHNQVDIFEPYTDDACSESAYVIVESGTDLVLKVTKLAWNFHSYIWNQTSERFGLQGLTSRAICYFFIVNLVQQIEEGITLILLSRFSPQTASRKTVVAKRALIFARSTALSCLDVARHSIVSREVIWALDLSWKLFNLWCIQPLRLLRNQLPDAKVPRKLEDKAKELKFPEKRIRIGSGIEPRAKYLKVFFLDYIIVNDELLSILDDDQALAIFCRELGHWALGHIYIRDFFTALEFVLGDLLLLACVTDKASSFYRIDPGAHIVVHVSLMKYFVRSMLCSLIHGIAGIVNSHLEIGADEFASQTLRMQSPSILAVGPRWGSLVDAWKKLAPADPENFQFFDESFASFFHGQPTIPHRLSKTDRRLRFSPDIQARSISPLH